MRFTNFTAGCAGKIFTVILCILLGVVLTIGSVVGGVVYFGTRKGMMEKVSDYASKQGINLEWDEEIKGLSIYDWGKKMLPLLQGFTTTPIGEIEKIIGYGVFSKSINEMTGLEIEDIKQTTLANFGQTFAEKMTVAAASEKFNIQFPDLPVFQRDEFLDSPLNTAFTQIEQFELQDFIKVTENSSPVLKSIADLQIGQLSDEQNGLDARVNSLPLRDVITIIEEGENKSSPILIKLKDVQVGNLGASQTNDLVMEMQLQEVIEITPQSNSVLWELRETPIGELGGSQTDEKIKNMKIADLIDIDENSSNILQYFADNDVTLAGTDEYGNPNGVNVALKTMRLKDIMTLKEPGTEGGSTKLMWALRDCPIETIPADETNPAVLGIEDTLKITPLSELLDVGDTYVWEYIGQSTIENLGQRIDDMAVKDVIEIDETSPAILRKMRLPLEGEDPNMFGSEDIKLAGLGTKLQPLIQSLKLAEVIDIEEGVSEPILIALKDTKIEDMNEKIKSLKINEVFSQDNYSSGVLALIDENTEISDIPMELSAALATGNLQVLMNIGLAQDSEYGMPVELQAGIRNSNLNDLIANYANAGTGLIPNRYFLGSSVTEIDMDFIDSLLSLGFQPGDTLVLQNDVTIRADEYTTLFNIMTNGHNITIEQGAIIRNQVYESQGYVDKGGFIFISNDHYTQYDIVGGGDIIGEFSHPDIKAHLKIKVHIIDIQI